MRTDKLLKKLFYPLKSYNDFNNNGFSDSFDFNKYFRGLKDNVQKGGDNGKNVTKLLLLILLVIVVFFIYFYYNNKNNNIVIQKNTQQYTNPEIEKEVIIEKNYPLAERRIVNTLPILREYDYKTFNDPLTPPYKRDDYMIPAHIVDPVNFGMYTRGVPPVFKKMGYLIDESSSNDDKYKILNLMGRQKYYNSNIYQYYVVSSNRDDNIKFDLGKKYRNELYTGDKVRIHQLNKDYVVHIDKNLDFDYNPYVI